jgi:hypothetical protein
MSAALQARPPSSAESPLPRAIRPDGDEPRPPSVSVRRSNQSTATPPALDHALPNILAALAPASAITPPTDLWEEPNPYPSE